MIKIKLMALYNQPYYDVYKDGIREGSVNGYKQAEKICVEAKKRGEEVELEDSVLKEHNQLISLLKS